MYPAHHCSAPCLLSRRDREQALYVQSSDVEGDLLSKTRAAPKG